MQKRMNDEFVFDALQMEPTPLSDAIHNKHLRNQQNEQFGFLPLPEQLHREQIGCNISHYRRPAACAERPTKKRRTNVGFATHVMIHFSPYAREELESCWYTRADMVNFKSDRKTVYKKLNSGNCNLNQLQESMSDDYRGLEAFFSASDNRTIQQKRTQAANCVLQEQRAQRADGIIDAEAIRQVSCSQTKWARDRAERLGQEDAEQVARSFQSQKTISTTPGPHHTHRITPLHEPATRP